MTGRNRAVPTGAASAVAAVVAVAQEQEDRATGAVLPSHENARHRLLRGALALLAENGWFMFGHHSDDSPVPEMEFWGERYSDDGLPMFERVKA